jgi:cellulose synthase/poly-beta-1,6-N-acetylglucosamine synthase-like glycosyltransferase
MDFSTLLYYLIAGLSLVNFARILAMLVGSDFYDIAHMRQTFLKKPRPSRLGVSVIIPAYNEEVGVIRTVESILKNTHKKIQIIVVNDGSTDNTKARLRSFQRRHPGKITVVSQKNAGKAAAINRAIRYWATEHLVMVVDADSLLHPNAIARMALHFRNPRTIAVAANVKVIPTRSFLGIAQRFEYLISYRVKRSLSVFNAEYIIGGVGSTFRRKAILQCGLYDTDTMTEDIDLTVKLIKHYGNRQGRIAYAADCMAYTEHVLRFWSLVKQRFRWKYGRLQTFLKNRELFFSRQKRHAKILTWYQLPYALFGEFTLLLEPILVGFIIGVTIAFGDLSSLLWVYAIVSAFVLLLVLGEDTEPWPAKLLLFVYMPLVYLLMYVLTAVEFLALLKSIRNIKNLRNKRTQHGAWQHVERKGGIVKLPT